MENRIVVNLLKTSTGYVVQGYEEKTINWNGFAQRFGVYDVADLAKECSDDRDIQWAFREGFQTAQSLNKKEFTEEDVLRALLVANSSMTIDQILTRLRTTSIEADITSNEVIITKIN